MIYHAALQGQANVVIVANDSDTLILGMYACEMDKSRRFYNYVGSTYAEIEKFATVYRDIAFYFSLFHSLIGCDTRSYYRCCRKTIPWNCDMKCPSSLLLINDLGKGETHFDATLDDCMEFVHHYVYITMSTMVNPMKILWPLKFDCTTSKL